jgi:glycosyltransferase involved in cell wall biosynthesis
MWHGARVAVIVPAYQEARLIGRMLRRLPVFVDRVYVVDDASTDGTAEHAARLADPRIVVLRHAENRGVGAAIVSGYERALADGADLLAVMAADDQMDPEELPLLLDRVWRGGADYAKGNRFLHPEAARMPRLRRFGSSLLSVLTRSATALDVDDCQCGFTVLASAAARRLPLAELWPRYGYPNDLLGMLAAAGSRVADVPVRPIYADEDSGLRAHHLVTIVGVIARRWRRSKSSSSRSSSARLRLPIRTGSRDPMSPHTPSSDGASRHVAPADVASRDTVP